MERREAGHPGAKATGAGRRAITVARMVAVGWAMMAVVVEVHSRKGIVVVEAMQGLLWLVGVMDDEWWWWWSWALSLSQRPAARE